VVVVEGETARTAVDAELASGKAFAEVAGQHSIDISKAAGGEFGTIPLSGLNEVARQAVANARVGQTTPWLNSGDKHVKFLLEDVVPEKREPLTPVLRRQMRRQLMLDRGVVQNDIQKEMLAMRTQAKVDIANKEFADAYQKFIEAFLKDAQRGGG
jgi:parvulin-like peptidyl-prolyl isomerase